MLSRSKYFSTVKSNTSQSVFCLLQEHTEQVLTRICKGYLRLAYHTKLWCAMWIRMQGKKQKQKIICSFLQPYAATSPTELSSPHSQLGVSGICNIWIIWLDKIHDRIQHESKIALITFTVTQCCVCTPIFSLSVTPWLGNWGSREI